MPTLQLVRSNTNRPVITLRINNHDYRFLIDTGATHTVLDPSLLPDLNATQVASRRQLSCYTVGGRVEADYVSVRFRFAGAELQRTVFDRRICEKNDSTIGLIGQDILQQFKSVTFDNVRHVVKFELQGI